MKCQAYDLISMVNDEYLKVNNALKRENTQLQSQNEKLKREIGELKSQQLKASKPFVDLTCDDDSDVEIIDDTKLVKDKVPAFESLKSSKNGEIIEVDEDETIKPEESEENRIAPLETPDKYSMFDSFDMKYGNDSAWDIKELEKFIVGQI